MLDPEAYMFLKLGSDGITRLFVEITKRAIPEIEPKKFYVSQDGIIYNSLTHRYSTGNVNHRGYVVVELTNKEGKRISTFMHRVVELVYDWFPGCNELEVNHINGIHDDNRLENLELVNHTENVRHAFATGLNTSYGENHPYSTTTDENVKKVAEFLTKPESRKYTYREIGEMFGISEIMVVQIVTNTTWNRSTEGYDLKKRNSRYTDEQVHQMCQIFVRLKGCSFTEIANAVVAELNLPNTENTRHKIGKIYYKSPSYFTRITDNYDY